MQLGRAPIPTRAEQVELGRLVQRWQQHPGGPDAASPAVQRAGLRARNRLVSGNLRLALDATRLYRGYGMEVEDLMQEAAIGMQRAAEKFDPERGYSFTTFAYWWMRQSMKRCLSSNGMIRLPVRAEDERRQMNRAADEFRRQHGRHPNDAELADALSRKPLVVERLRDANVAALICSLDAPAPGEGEGSLWDVLSVEGSAQQRNTSSHAAVAEEEMIERVHKAWALLSEEHAAVLTMRIQLECTYADIGEELGVTGYQARKKFLAAIERLRTLVPQQEVE